MILFIKISIFFLRWISHATLKKADVIITCHEEGKNIISKIVPREKIVIIPPASNIEIDEYPIREKHEYVEILSVGALIKRKNYKTLIEIFHNVKSKVNKNIILRIIGEGPDRDNLEKLIEQIGLKNYVILEGHVVNNRIKEYYKKADIYCSTSLCESFGIAVLEAMGCGLPVVAMRPAGFEHVITHGENGFLVEQRDLKNFEEYLITLINNENLREEIGRKAYEVVKKEYTSAAIAKKYYNLYKKLCYS
jgi:glycosyltransferase involved in cell wall biosynthesis